MTRIPFFVALLVAFPLGQSAVGADRPNVLWITAEDMSPTLGCYGDSYAITPNIDRLSRQSVRYTQAFATAPVCSPSRSCLITGCYAPSLGTHQMRSAFPIPAEIRGFPALLRQRGYYATNNVKTDYNTGNWKQVIAASWNENSAEAHWRNRKSPEQPFFSIFNLMTSHQSRSMVWPREQFVEQVQSRLSPDEVHSPSRAPVPPYYPDTPQIRRTIARFYDCVTAMDKEVGEILAQLEADGLADKTIVFFYSDHGSGMPRHKRALLDSGMHVPLLIRFPEKYKHLAPVQPGETTDQMVSFIDFAPTVLSLAGIEAPEYMQGRAFLGKSHSSSRQYVYGHRDRIDEVIDVARSVRDKRYLYIRNYMPHLGYNQPSAWPEQGEIRAEIARCTDRLSMTDPQWHFAGPTRLAEELYDCAADPRNLSNLASSPQHVEILQRLRDAHQRHLRETRDLGFIPESIAWEMFAESTPWQAARMRDLNLEAIYQAAAKVGVADESDLQSKLFDGDASIRYWGVIGLMSQDSIHEMLGRRLQKLAGTEHESMAVRIASAEALLNHCGTEAAMPLLTDALRHSDLNVVLHAARTIELQGQNASQLIPAMRGALARAERIRPPETPATVVEPGDQDLAMFIGFSARSFLSHVDKGEWIRLFDGATLDGWKALAPGEVTAADGEIRMLAKGANLWLLHETEFDDFELYIEARMPDVYNSGIGFRCAGKSGKPKGYQCEIDRRKSGMIYAIGSGWVWPKGGEETKRFHQLAGDAFRDNQWNAFRIRCEGDRIRIWVNGVQTADVRDERFTRGSFALQHHGKGDVHQFRAIRVRKL